MKKTGIFIKPRSPTSSTWILILFVNISFVLVTMAKFANNVDSDLLYYNTSDNFIPCSFNPLCFCKYDERTEIYENLVRLWHMVKFNKTEYNLAFTKILTAIHEDQHKIYHVSPQSIRQLANSLVNSTSSLNLPTRLNSLFEYGPVFDIDCDNVPIEQIPTEYNAQGVMSHVSISGSQLIILDGSAFAGLEIQGIQLTKNQLYFISEYAFSSMSNKLIMLDLSDNLLDEVPLNAFKTQKVLEWLNLNNNLINSISGDWFSLPNSLRKLILSGNSIDYLPQRLLNKFQRLAWLDLSSNFISNLTHESLPPNVQTLNLMKNRLSDFPLEVFKLRSLAWLDISNCDIENVPTEWPIRTQPIQLSQVDVSDNFIQAWPSKPFGSQLVVLDLNLNKNYIKLIPPFAFNVMNIFRLSLGHNQIQKIDSDSFSSLESTLKYLNLENNLLESIPWTSLRNLSALNHLYIGSNLLQDHRIGLPEGYECKLTHLGLNGNLLGRIPKGILTHCSQLIHLNLGYNHITHLDEFAHLSLRGRRLRNLHTLVLRNNPLRSLSYRTSHQKLALTINVEHESSTATSASTSNSPSSETMAAVLENSISASTEETTVDHVHPKTSSSSSHSIQNIFTNELFPNLRELSLSFCEIYGELEPFSSLSLVTLEISAGLKSTIKLHPTTFSSLRQLEWLALDHNHLQILSPYTFYSNRKLSYVNLEWNRIEILPRQLFHPDIHHSILQLRLSHNKIASVQSHSFISFAAINLDLSYNLISNIEQEAFTQFTPPSAHHHLHLHQHQQQLQYPDLQHLKGNAYDSHNSNSNMGRKFSSISSSTTQFLNADPFGTILREYDSIGGLHLYLSHNQLSQLKTHVFTSHKFSLIDLSYNQLTSFTFDSIGSLTTVGTLNLSFNAIEHVATSQITIHWLKTLDLSHNRLRTVDLSTLCVTNHLDLSFNRIESINQSYFPNNCSVKELNLRKNQISSLDPPSFANLRDLTAIYLDSNKLNFIPPVLFIRNTNLRHLDLSHNKLRTLPRDSLVGTVLESVNLSQNRFSSIPFNSLSQISRRLKRLDMSHNSIEHLDSTMFLELTPLLHLNLSSNRLNSLPDSAFANLASLRELDLSHNLLRTNFKELFHFLPQLKVLRLSDCGLKTFPFLPLVHLISLDLSSNGLNEIKIQSMSSLGKLRELDLSNNKLTNAKIPAWSPLHNLKSLKLSKNPFRSLTRDTLYGLTRLEILELQELDSLERFDSDVFSYLSSLRSLSVESYPNIEKYRFRLGAVLSTLIHLEELNVIIKEPSLSDQLSGGILPKLRKLHIHGENLKRIEPIALEGLQNCFHMELAITHTSINEIPQRIFDLIQRATWAKLELSHNKLTTLDSTSIYMNKTMWYSKGTRILEGGLLLDGNEFICDCDLVWLGEWLRRWLRESFQYHSIDNIPLLHSVYENLRGPKCKDSKGNQLSIVEIYSDTMCHASALSSAAKTIHQQNILIMFIYTISCLAVLFISNHHHHYILYN